MIIDASEIRHYTSGRAAVIDAPESFALGVIVGRMTGSAARAGRWPWRRPASQSPACSASPATPGACPCTQGWVGA